MFEPEKLRLNFIDLFSAPRRALKGKKIATHLMGLILGYIPYLILTYLALLLAGESLSSTWSRYGLYPFFSLTSSQLSGIASWIVYILAVIVWLVITLLAATVVTRITYKELKGDPFYSLIGGITFMKRHWRTVVFSPLAVLLIIMFFLLIAGIMALVGKIPILGGIVFVGLYPLYFFGAIFTIYCVVVLAVLILYLPAILAGNEDDALSTTFQSYTITWNQPWRIVAYSTLIAVLALVGTTFFGWAITAGYHFINLVFGLPWLMGSSLVPVLAWAEQIVFTGYGYLFTYVPGQLASLSPLTADINLVYLSGWEKFLGSLLAVLLMLIYGSVLAYGLSIISVGQSLSFIIFKLRTDDENLLEREDAEDLDAECKGEAVIIDVEDQESSPI